MKKYLISAIAVCMAMALTACGSEAKTEETKEEATATTAASFSDSELNQLYSDDFVTLGDYKGLEVTYEVEEPSEEDINSSIDSDLSNMTTTEVVNGRAVQTGDVVNIDYVGTKDGVAFSGGTASGYDLEIGSGNFIPGFEDGLIGANKGDNLDLNLTFPENYQTADLAGADVVFNVTVNEIKEKVKPELTDEVVASMGEDYKTVSEYKEAVRNRLYESNKEIADTQLKTDLLMAATNNATIKDTPEWLVDLMSANIRYSAEKYAQMYGIDLETFVSMALGETMEQFEEECSTYGKETADQTIVICAIAQKENLKISDEEYGSNLENLKSSTGSSDEELKSSGQADYLISYLQTNAVTDFLKENANIVDKDGNKVNP